MNMTSPQTEACQPRRNRYWVAVVLSTALGTFGSSAAAATASRFDPRAIQDISRYCTTCWKNARLHPDSWTDCTQEVFCRLLERVEPQSWTQVLQEEGEERREFLRAIDAVKKRTQRARKLSPHGIDTVADRRPAAESRLNEDLQAVRQAAKLVLSERQRRILELSMEGWTVHQIAEELQIPAERVSDEKYKAIRRLRSHFQVA